MKKITLLFAIVFLGIIVKNQGQSNYKSAVGLRAGIPIEASFKQFISEPGAIEVHAGLWHDASYYGFNYFRAGAMYQHHFPIGSIEGFTWYVGGGAFVQFFSWKHNDVKNYATTALGIHAVGGVDYKFPTIPLNVSADWMPTIFFGDTYYKGFGGGYGALAVRYVIR